MTIYNATQLSNLFIIQDIINRKITAIESQEVTMHALRLQEMTLHKHLMHLSGDATTNNTSNYQLILSALNCTAESVLRSSTMSLVRGTDDELNAKVIFELYECLNYTHCLISCHKGDIK